MALLLGTEYEDYECLNDICEMGLHQISIVQRRDGCITINVHLYVAVFSLPVNCSIEKPNHQFLPSSMTTMVAVVEFEVITGKKRDFHCQDS